MIDIDGLRALRTRLDRDRATIFQGWPADPGVRDACWRALEGGVDALIALGPDAPGPAIEGGLRRLVQSFAAINDGSFEKPEREDLCKVLYEVGSLCGVDAATEWVEAYRTW